MIRLGVEVLTGLSAEAGESSELLEAKAWKKRKAKLDELGGPPVRRRDAWHVHHLRRGFACPPLYARATADKRSAA